MITKVIIPARFDSRRFPGKPLAEILGKPMIQHVAENAISAIGRDNVVVATDDERIDMFLKSLSITSVITGRHRTGTDRIAEVVSDLEGVDVIINLQGDEPLIDYRAIHRIAYAKFAHMDNVICAMSRIMMDEDECDQNMVKVVTNNGNQCVYMSREPITDVYKQCGLYAMTPAELEEFTAAPTGTDGNEGIEILRFLDLGKKISMVEIPAGNLAVDILKHVGRVEKLIDQRERDRAKIQSVN